jgi:seryl-tRNA synthetase
MLDINFIRENLDKVKHSVEARKSKVDIDVLLKLDDERRKLTTKVDELRSRKNDAARAKDIEAGKKVKEELDSLEGKLTEVESKWKELMLQVPNILLEEVPIGDVSKNKVIRSSGEKPVFDFKIKDHIELGKALDIIDFDRGVKVSGFRGYFLKNEGAILQLAVLNYALDHLISKSYHLIIPPVVVRGFAMEGSGQFPFGKEETYKFEGEEDAYLAGTSEVALMAMHADEILDLKDLPKKMVGFSSCFRTEVGSYGKDTKGLYRLHEFYKVEQVILSENDEQQSLGFFEEMQDNVEEIMQELGLPYQVVALSSEDMGKKAALTYDTETWMPAREGYGETHSNSIVLDFQTRRLKIRYKDADGNSKFAHALNNTAIASPRILIAILENFQQKDGSIKIPEALQKYTNFSEIRPK